MITIVNTCVLRSLYERLLKNIVIELFELFGALQIDFHGFKVGIMVCKYIPYEKDLTNSYLEIYKSSCQLFIGEKYFLIHQMCLKNYPVKSFIK